MQESFDSYELIAPHNLLFSNIYILLYGTRQGGLWHCSDNTFFLLSFLEKQHGWYASYSILGGNVRAVIRVYFVTSYLSCIFLCQFLDYWCYHFTRSAPWCPKLHQNRGLTSNDSIPACICRYLNCTFQTFVGIRFQEYSSSRKKKLMNLLKILSFHLTVTCN